MNTFKKIIFLSNNEKNNHMGLLTIERRNNNIFGTLKTYGKNFDGEYILGIRSDKEIIKQNVSLKNNIYSFVLSNSFNLSNSLGCVLLKNNNTELIPLIWGNEKDNNYKSSIINSLRENIEKLSSIKTQNSNYKNDSNTPKQEYIDKANNNTDHSNTCVPLLEPQQHIDYAYESYDIDEVYCPINNIIPDQHKQNKTPDNQSIITQSSEVAVASTMADLFETNDTELEEIIDNNFNNDKPNINNIESGNHKFYDMIADQLKELFDRYPKENNLSTLIENSTWVKIEGDIDNKSYVVGIITDNDDIKYICYGVPGEYNNEPPLELRGYSQWLPTDINNPYNNGYWVMYQDADTGENILIN